jgi:hypothetical protein
LDVLRKGVVRLWRGCAESAKRLKLLDYEFAGGMLHERHKPEAVIAQYLSLLTNSHVWSYYRRHVRFDLLAWS